MSGSRSWYYQSERPSWGNPKDSISRQFRNPVGIDTTPRVRVTQRSISVEAPSRGRAEAEQRLLQQRELERLQAEKQQMERQEQELRKKRAGDARRRIQEQLRRAPRTLNRSCSFQPHRSVEAEVASPRRFRSPSVTRLYSTGSGRMSRSSTSRADFEAPCTAEELKQFYIAEEKRKHLEAERTRLEEEREAERQRIEAEQKRLQAEASSRRIAAATNQWYSVLDLPPTASVDEVKRAFRELALMHHPDKSFETCDDTFKRVQMAYQQGLRLARAVACPPSSSQPLSPQKAAQVPPPCNASFKPPDRVPVVEKDGRKKPEKILLLTASSDRTVRVWDMESFECERTLWAHSKGVVSLSIASDGDHFVTGSWDRTAKIWSLKDGTCKMTIQPNYGHRTTSMMVNACFTLDGSEIAMVAQDSAVRIWSAESGECRMTLRGHTCDVKCACFSPNGGILISGSIDHTARIWNADTGKLEHILRGHQGTIVAAAFAPDSVHAATASDDCSAMIWNANTGKAALKLRGHTNTVSSVCFSSDGSSIVTGSEDGCARVWSFATGDCMQIVAPEVSRKSGVLSVAMSPDGRLLATGSHDHKTRVWCLKTGQCECILRKHEDAVSVVAFLRSPHQC